MYIGTSKSLCRKESQQSSRTRWTARRTHDVWNICPTIHVPTREPAFHKILLTFRSVKVLACWRLAISSNLGWRQVPVGGDSVAGGTICEAGVTGEADEAMPTVEDDDQNRSTHEPIWRASS